VRSTREIPRLCVCAYQRAQNSSQLWDASHRGYEWFGKRWRIAILESGAMQQKTKERVCVVGLWVRNAGVSKRLVSQLFLFLSLLAHHHLHELLVVNLTVTVDVGFADHLIDFFVSQLFSQVGHHVTQLSS